MAAVGFLLAGWGILGEILGKHLPQLHHHCWGLCLPVLHYPGHYQQVG